MTINVYINEQNWLLIARQDRLKNDGWPNNYVPVKAAVQISRSYLSTYVAVYCRDIY